MSTLTSDSIEIAVMRSLCKRFRTDFSRKVLLALDSGSYLSLEFNVPSYGSDYQKFSKDYLLFNLLRKWKGWKTSASTYDVAFNAWIDAERRCFQTNRFLNSHAHSYRALNFISKVQRKIERVIGKWPPDNIFDDCKWSAGATVSLRRSECQLSQKVSRTITVTRAALKHLVSVMDDEWLKALPAVPYRIVDRNRGVMVPKTAKTDRPIAAEPAGNAFLQQGVGRFIRRRLKGFGVNLDDQSVNQDAAFRALVDSLATVDLSSASDTLSVSTVRLFMPPAWYDLLSDLRSSKTEWNSRTYVLDKFSSMGNAYTFELESLIFWAISKVVVDEIEPGGFCTTYGDDIIVPQSCTELLYMALDYFGFLVNNEKSYRSGYFFESCGKQYCALEDVTPAFQKEVVGKDLSELIRFHNRIYRWGLRNEMALVKDAVLLIEKSIEEAHPRLKRLPRVPVGHPGDLGLLTPNLKPNRNGDFTCLCLIEQPVSFCLIKKNEVRGLYAYKLRKRHEFANSLDNGHTGEQIATVTRLREQRVWASSLS